MFPASLQQEFGVALAHSFLIHVRQEMQKVLNEEAEKRDGLEESDIPPIIHDVIMKKLTEVRGNARLSGFGPATIADIRKQYSRHIGAVKKEVFGNLKIQSKTQRAITTLNIELISRNNFGPLQSQVVFAGYGEDEYLPHLFSTSVEVMVRNKLRAAPRHDAEISTGNRAAIVPFAQQEMVHAFMNGIDPKIDDHIRKTSSGLFLGMVNQILDAVEKNDAAFGQKRTFACDQETTDLHGLFSAF